MAPTRANRAASIEAGGHRRHRYRKKTRMQDIHKIKPIHGWREPLGEFEIIVIGVLIALIGKQAVENLHYRTDLREAREAPKVELESNLWSIDNRLQLNACSPTG